MTEALIPIKNIKLTFITPVDTSDLDLLSWNVLFLEFLTLQPVPQGAFSCVSISSNDYLHWKTTHNMLELVITTLSQAHSTQGLQQHRLDLLWHAVCVTIWSNSMRNMHRKPFKFSKETTKQSISNLNELSFIIHFGRHLTYCCTEPL